VAGEHITRNGGRMQMEFLQAQVPHPKTVANYKKTAFEFVVEDVHQVDQMDMHRQIGEMIFSTLTNTSLIASKLQVSLNNIQSELKLEKISSGQGQQNQIIIRIGDEDWV
jgi:hypothetical protein